MSRTRQEQFLLAHLGRQLAGETRFENFLQIMAAELENLLGSRDCRIYLDAKGRRWAGGKKGGADPLEGPLGRKVLRAVQSGISVRLDKGRGGARNLLAAPMMGHDHLLGFIVAANKKSGDFNADDEGFLMLLASITGYAIENERLNHELQDSHLETIYRLATVAEYRDPVDLTGHLRRMSRYSAMIAEGMGFGKADTRRILYASPLHDIGKVAIPDNVLHKPAKLTPEEYDVIKRHTTIGATILSHAKTELLKLASRIALAHHEKFDGSGYPKGLKGSHIPVEARIVSVADVFDALCSRRVYKPAWDVSQARSYIAERAGKEFDPKVVEAFEAAWPKVNALMQNDWFLQGQKAPPKNKHRHHPC